MSKQMRRSQWGGGGASPTPLPSAPYFRTSSRPVSFPSRKVLETPYDSVWLETKFSFAGYRDSKEMQELVMTKVHFI